MIDVSSTYCGNHFTVNVNQTIIPHALSLSNDIGQLFLSKIRGKNTMSLCLLTCAQVNSGFRKKGSSVFRSQRDFM